MQATQEKSSKKNGNGKNGSQGKKKVQMEIEVKKEASDDTLVHPEKESEKKMRRIDPEELGFQFKRKLGFDKFPDRPGFGTMGKKIKLIANCFSLKVPSGSVNHYDITVNRKQTNPSKESSTVSLFAEGDKKYRCMSTKRNREVIQLMLNTNPLFKNIYAAYDGKKNIYTRSPIEANFPAVCEVVMPVEDENPDDPREDVYTVQVKPAYKEDGSCCISLDLLHAFYDKKVSTVPQETIMALETILREGPCLQFTPVGRSFFYPPNPRNLHPLGGGLEVWFGYHQSIRLGQWGPMVNLNQSATSFFQKGPVLQFVADFLNTRVSELRKRTYLDNTDIKRLSAKLKHIKIEVTHLKNYRRKYRILRLTKQNAHQLEFELTDKGKTVKKTVATYFRERYGRSLEFPNLPCLQVQPEKKKTYIPLEVCEIVEGQHCKKKLDSLQTAQMIKFTASSPAERFSVIKQIAEDSGFNKTTHAQNFGLEVSSQPIRFEGRVLDSPTVRYRGDEKVKPVDGSWNIRQKKYFIGAAIKSWVLLNFAPRVKYEDVKKFIELLVQVGNVAGMSITNPKFVQSLDPSRCDFRSVFSEMKSKYKAELAVIVLPANDRYFYARIKQIAETNVGLRTQCIREPNVTNPKKMSTQLVSNICLKINTKAGGENNTLVPQELSPVLFKPVIIIGADVNHPGVTESTKPSLAACVCSLDNRLAKYAVSIRAQMNMDDKKQAVEIILDLKNMVLELLKTFYKHTKGKKPEKIIFYRDGVSEGQFDKVHEYEVKCIREACRSLPGHYEPGITFIVVQKRHHIRFMPQDPKDGAGIPKNVPPGTTVDTAVTDPVKFDFFLCSHLGLKGTSRPSHYTVLEDDNKFTADDLQKMTYQLCHTYARCTKSISIPVPVAYADLAAYRARQHLEAGLEETASGSDDSTGGGDPLSISIMESIKVTGELEKAMHFV